MSEGKHTITEFYCRLVCPFLGEQLHYFEGSSKEDLPLRMCPAMASIAIQTLAENIVDREPDSEVRPLEADSPSGPFMNAVQDAAHEYNNLAGACAKMLIAHGTATANYRELCVIEDEEIYKRLSSCMGREN